MWRKLRPREDSDRPIVSRKERQRERGWRSGTDTHTGVEGQTEKMREPLIKKEQRKRDETEEGEREMWLSEEGGEGLYGQAAGGSGSAAGGEIMGADEPESKH